MKRISIIGITAALFSLPAAAQEPGWYAGVSIGQSKAGESCSGMTSGISCDDKTTTWKFLGGYQFSRNLAAEVGYTNELTRATANGLGLSDEIKASAFELVAIPSLPLGGSDFSLFGKLGLYYASTEETTNFAGNNSESNVDLTYGVGLAYQINRNFGARLEWQRYNQVGGGAIGKENIDALNLGLLYRF